MLKKEDKIFGQDELKTVVTLTIANSSGVALKTLFGAGA